MHPMTTVELSTTSSPSSNQDFFRGNYLCQEMRRKEKVEEKDNKEGGRRTVRSANQFRQTAVYTTSSITAVICSHSRVLTSHQLIYCYNTHIHTITHNLTSFPIKSTATVQRMLWSVCCSTALLHPAEAPAHPELTPSGQSQGTS